MVKGQKVTLAIGSRFVDMVWVGGGATTMAYHEDGFKNTVYLIVADLAFKDGSTDIDTAKDVLVDAYNRAPRNRYLPKIEYLGRTYVSGPELDKNCKVYKMPFYRDLKMSEKALWVEVKKLHMARAKSMKYEYDAHRKATGERPSMTFLGNKAAKSAGIMAKKANNSELMEALACLYWAVEKNGREDLTFEFQKSNLGVDSRGHLVLRDPVYCSKISVAIKNDREEN